MSAQPNTPQARRKWVVPSRSGDGATTFELFFDLVLGRALFPHLFPDNGEPLNHTRYLFLDDRSREFYIDWERSARGVVSACASPPGTTPPTAHSWPSSGELATRSPEFRTWWAGHTVKTHTAGTKAIRHPLVGELTVAFETLTLASTPDVRRPDRHLPHRPGHPVRRRARPPPQLDRDHKYARDFPRLIRAVESTDEHIRRRLISIHSCVSCRILKAPKLLVGASYLGGRPSHPTFIYLW